MAGVSVMPGRAHGSWSGYAYWKCRCEPCLDAGRAYRAARKCGEANPVPSRARARKPASTPRLEGPVRGYRYRIQPSAQAQARLVRLLGGARFVYNAYVALARDEFAAGRKHPSGFDGRKTIVTDGRRATETAWMRGLPVGPLYASVLQAADAYDNFFGSVAGRRKGQRVGRPRFKKRGHGGSATFDGASFSIAGGHRSTRSAPGGRLRLSKIGTIRVGWHRALPSEPTAVTITLEADGTWWASFLVRTPVPAPSTPTRGSRAAGVDLGLADFASIVYSDGSREKIANPRHLKAAQSRLRRAQKAYSRTTPGSKNREKARARVARLHSQVANQRSNHSRQLVARLTRENQAVAVETLNIRGMGRTRLAKSIHDAGWGQFLNHLDEAAQKRGTNLSATPAAFPSSRVCSACGVNSGPKPLHIRTWTCPDCGLTLDRDYNAAVNILVAAGPAETINACGGNVRRRLAGATAREAGTRPTPTSSIGRVEGNRSRRRDQVEAIQSAHTGHHPAAHKWNKEPNDVETRRINFLHCPVPERE